MESKITIFLVIINAFFTYQGFRSDSFLSKFIFNIAKIRAGEQYRLLSSGFLHADWIHFAFNMISLWSFSKYLELNLGSLQVLMIYFVSLLTGNLLTLFFYKNQLNYSALGASGAVSGIVFATVLLFPEINIYMPIKMPGFVYALFYLIFSIYGMKKNLGNIGHSAHLGGAIGGVLAVLLLYPNLIQERLFFLGGILIVILVLYFMIKNND